MPLKELAQAVLLSDDKWWVSRNAQIILDCKAGGCVDCGESDPRCLDFDHVRGKKLRSVSLMKTGYSVKVLREEIAKCEVRCANCHRKRTAERRVRPSQ